MLARALTAAAGPRRFVPAPIARQTPAVAALGAAAAGAASLLSALTEAPGTHGELARLTPISAPPALHALVVPASIALVAVGAYLWRRRERALLLTVALLVLVGLAQLLERREIETVIGSWGLAAFLAANRHAFSVSSRAVGLRAAALVLLAIAGLVLIPFWPATGLLVIPWLALQAAAAGTVGYLVFRAPPPPSASGGDRAVAAALIRAHGRDTLASFKLRSDLDYLFADDGSAFAGFRTCGGVLLVSGDPVGRAESLPGLVVDLVALSERHDLALAAVGASEELAAHYRAHGLRSLYIGDEAVVETESFSLAGRGVRKLRQSVHRLEREGYRVECIPADAVDRRTRSSLERVSRRWLQGERERGFSMALDPAATAGCRDGVFVLARDAVGRPRAFLHLVPSYGRAALSLSSMRRDRDTPNGLTEFLVVRAIEQLRARGVEEISLNFAAFGRILRTPGSAAERALRSIVRLGNGWFQIESLQHFSAKFGPRWEPRYLVYGGLPALPRVALATLRAEGQLPRRAVARRSDQPRTSGTAAATSHQASTPSRAATQTAATATTTPTAIRASSPTTNSSSARATFMRAVPGPAPAEGGQSRATRAT